MEIKGLISDIERYAINDGFGLRTTVFLKGCPLRCRWCCNPETQSAAPEMVYFKDKCIGCGECAAGCRYGALKSGLVADRAVCENCWQRDGAFQCTEKCYARCRKVSGTWMMADDVVARVRRDLSLYRRSGGGATLSGGEPMIQPEFVEVLCAKLAASWIDVAMESCGMCPAAEYDRIAPYLSMMFMDLKHMDSEKHAAWTGASNGMILESARHLSELSLKHGFPLIFRVPVVPGFNDSPEEIDAICRFIDRECPHAVGVELLPYHKLGRGKYHSLGREYPMGETVSPDAARMEVLWGIVACRGITQYRF